MADHLELTPNDWERSLARLRTYVRRRVDPSSSEDVIGAILVRLVQRSDHLKNAESPTAWMLRVASNVIIDHHRRQSAKERAMISAQPVMEPRGSTLSNTGNESSELAKCLIPLIRGLPEIYREALLLTDIEGVSQAQAARRLSLSVSGMKSRVQRGRAKLKKSLLRCCKVELGRRGDVVHYSPRTTGCQKC